MPDALTIVILGNMRAVGPDGCTLEWLARRVNFGRDAIERALGRLVMDGTMTEQNGVYKLQEVRRVRHALRRLKRAWRLAALRSGQLTWPLREVRQ